METKLDSKFAAGSELLKEYGAAVTSGDFERWISLWTEAGTQMAPDAPTRTSREEIRAAMEPVFDLYDHKMSVHPRDARLADDWGFVRGEFTHELSSKDSADHSRRAGKFLTIVEKQSDGTWKIACDCFNYDAPAP